MKAPENPRPSVHKQFVLGSVEQEQRCRKEEDEEQDDPIDSLEIFELVRHINDPEYPLTLEQLDIVNIERCWVEDDTVKLLYTPTIPHCSMAQMIGLMLKVKLLRTISKKYRTDVRVTPGAHANESEINKQLKDKERVAAALENPSIMRIIKKGIANSDRLPI